MLKYLYQLKIDSVTFLFFFVLRSKFAVNRILLLLFVVLFSSNLNAQCFSKAKAYSIKKYDKKVVQPGYPKWHIKSKFGHGRIVNVPMPEDFMHGKITAIDYYFTTFKTDTNFHQIGLDSARWANLEVMYPMVFAQIDSVPVRFIEQTLAQSKRDALFFFHGFVVHYQVYDMPMTEREKEIVYIEKLFKKGFDADDAPKWGSVRQVSGTMPGDILSVWGYNMNLGKPDTTIRSHAKWIHKTAKNNAQNDFVTAYREGPQVASDTVLVDLYRVPKNYYPGSTPPPFTAGMFGLMEQSYEDSKLRMLAFRKPALPNEVSGDLLGSLRDFEGDSIVLVIDVTSSMTKSIAQVLKWANSPKIKSKIKGIVLFNDGNLTPNAEKVIGNTGGIYFIKGLEGLQVTLVTAMRSGSGGDGVENDMEAVLKGRKEFGEGNYILVADNLCPPRDFSLISKLTFPVNVLLCNGIEAKDYYMDIVEGTGGVFINKRK